MITWQATITCDTSLAPLNGVCKASAQVTMTLEGMTLKGMHEDYRMTVERMPEGWRRNGPWFDRHLCPNHER